MFWPLLDGLLFCPGAFFQCRNARIQAGYPKIVVDQDVAGQGIGLYSLHPRDLVHAGLDTAAFISLPAGQVDAHAAGNQAQDLGLFCGDWMQGVPLLRFPGQVNCFLANVMPAWFRPTGRAGRPSRPSLPRLPATQLLLAAGTKARAIVV
jgi:hypothetical protein